MESSSDWILSPEELKNSPSRRDGLKEQQEREYRRKTCFLLHEAAKSIRMGMLSIATAMVYFQRFFAEHSFKEHDRFTVAYTCIFLAGKVEETPRRLKDVLVACWGIRHALDIKEKKMKPLDPNGAEFKKLKQEVLRCEEQLLHTLAFDFKVEHPYINVKVVVTNLVSKEWLPKAALTKVLEKAVHYVSDSLRTSLCLEHTPAEIAKACVYMALLSMEGTCTSAPAELGSWEACLAQVPAVSGGGSHTPDGTVRHAAVLNSVCGQIVEVLDKQGKRTESLMHLVQELKKAGRLRGPQQLHRHQRSIASGAPPAPPKGSKPQAQKPRPPAARPPKSQPPPPPPPPTASRPKPPPPPSAPAGSGSSMPKPSKSAPTYNYNRQKQQQLGKAVPVKAGEPASPPKPVPAPGDVPKAANGRGPSSSSSSNSSSNSSGQSMLKRSAPPSPLIPVVVPGSSCLELEHRDKRVRVGGLEPS